MSSSSRNASELPVPEAVPAQAGLWPEAPWSRFRARVHNRLAMHVPVRFARLKNERPLVSFTFDDVPRSAATAGADILGEHDARGTFYAAGDLTGSTSTQWTHATEQDLVALHRAGHELACHTFGHRRLHELGGSALVAEADRNEAFFRALDPSIHLQNFAYPWGLGDFRRKGALSRRFATCRSVQPGINQGTVDPHFLLSMPLEDRHIDAAGVDRALDEACQRGRWLIFYGHEVTTRPGEFTCPPALLRHALAGARRRDMQVASVAEAVRLAGI